MCWFFANFLILPESLHHHLHLIHCKNLTLTFVSSSLSVLVLTPDHAWHKAQLSLRRGGLGLRSRAHHSPAAYIASLSNSNCATSTYCHLISAIAQYNTFVLPSDALSANDWIILFLRRQLSDRLKEVQSKLCKITNLHKPY